MQELGPIAVNISNLFNNEPIRPALNQLSDKDKDTFANIFSESVANTIATDAQDKAGSAELLLGESDDLSGLLLDMQKAELALQLTLQIRNKIIDAYNEVMRMSV